MTIPLGPPSPSPCCHGYTAALIGQDGSLLTLKPWPPDPSPGPPRSSTSDTVATDRPWEDYFKNLFQRWDDRNNKTNPMVSDSKPKMVKQSLVVEDPCWDESILEKGDHGMNISGPHGHHVFPLVPPMQVVYEQPSFGSRAPPDASKLQQMPEMDNWESLSIEEALTCLELAVEMPAVENLICILQKCRKKKHLRHAEHVLIHICVNGLECLTELGNCLVATLVECGSMSFSQQVFHKLDPRTEYSWTHLIRGHIECGEPENAFHLFQKMQEDRVEASKFTFVALLKACARLRCVERGQEVLLEIVKVGLESDYFIGNTLVSLYAKCGSLAEAQGMFEKLSVQDAVSWTALISGYVEKGHCKEALKCFEQMQESGIFPDAITFICSLKACGSIRARYRGQEIHAQLATEGFEEDPFIGNVLVDMYVKCSLLAEAQDVFDDLSIQDVVSWTALIAGSAEQGENEKALMSYQWMQEQGLLPNSVTFASILKACGNMSDKETGKRIHAQIYAVACLETLEIITATALVDMYAKCRSMVDAQLVFDAMSSRDLVVWNALITGYTHQGESELVFQLFDRMRDESVQPDQITFLSALTACSHAGFVDKGQLYFDALSKEHDIIPTIKHYNCMIDLLGRAGQLKEALTMLRSMPFPPDLVAWTTLLAACRKWGNVEIGKQAFESALRLDEKHAAAFNSMFNIYVDANMWEEAKKIEAMRVNLEAVKEHTKSWIEIGGFVHTFVGGDARHPQFNMMYAKLGHAYAKLEERFMPGFDHVLQDIGDNAKEDGLCGHSEVLALAYGLINTPERTPLHVVKNLRVCDDCHVVMAVISKVELRAVSCRDACRVHAFREGKCCCED